MPLAALDMLYVPVPWTESAVQVRASETESPPDDPVQVPFKFVPWTATDGTAIGSAT